MDRPFADCSRIAAYSALAWRDSCLECRVSSLPWQDYFWSDVANLEIGTLVDPDFGMGQVCHDLDLGHFEMEVLPVDIPSVVAGTVG